MGKHSELFVSLFWVEKNSQPTLVVAIVENVLLVGTKKGKLEYMNHSLYILYAPYH
jgi:hypothetical protein